MAAGGGGRGGTELGKVESVQRRLKKVEQGVKELLQGHAFNAWLRQQSAPVEVVIASAASAVQGAALGGLMGALTSDLRSSMPAQTMPGMPPQAMASFQQAQALAGGPLIQARNFALMTGVNSGISCVMRRMRGVEDVKGSMVAAFGSGAIFSVVSGVGGQNVVGNAVMTGAFFSLLQGGMHKLGKVMQPPPDDSYYITAKNMLQTLGLERYEKNFKKGLLTDGTLHLLNDSALRDVRIPPGPRLLILEHVERNLKPGLHAV